MRAVTLTVAASALAVGVNAAITGQQRCNQYICITGTHDSSANIDTYTLGPPSGASYALKDYGWMALGFGGQMSGSPMVIAFANNDGSITLSHRQAAGHVAPTVTPNPPRVATLVKAQSFSNTTTTSIQFTVPSNSDSTTNKTSIIWAWSNQKPSGSGNSAVIAQHVASGNFQMALMAPFNSGGSGTSNTTNNTTNTNNNNNNSNDGGTVVVTPSGSSNKMLIAHVVCGSLGTMMFLPIGILIPRYARIISSKRWWFPVHSSVMGIMAFAFIVAAFAIAVSSFGGGFNSDHRRLGLTLFILMIFQILLGIFVHFIKLGNKGFKTSSGRGPSNFLHMLTGVVIVAIGFGTVWKGITEEWGIYSGTGNPNIGYKVGWGLIVAITALVYLAGLAFIPRQIRLERAAREYNNSSPPPGSRKLDLPKDSDGNYEMRGAQQGNAQGGMMYNHWAEGREG